VKSSVRRAQAKPRVGETCPRCRRALPGNERVTNRGNDMARRLAGGGLYGPRIARLLRQMVDAPLREAELPDDARADWERLRSAEAIEHSDGGWSAAQVCPRCRDEIAAALVPYECPLCGRLADPRASKARYDANLRTISAQYAVAPRILKRYPEAHAWGSRRERWWLPEWSPSFADLQRATKADAGTVTDTVAALASLKLIAEARGRAFRLNPIPCESCLSEDTTTPGRDHARDPIQAQLRFRVLQRDAFRCRYCGRGAPQGAILHLDHIIPVTAGGATTEDNLLTACVDCNLGKATTKVIDQ
jgi:predicted RNA-binding Zn-ribbon protein involved in translation (DUF1610 family)